MQWKLAACMLLFTCQIYVDFSSYSDIAIGLGLLLGYHIRPNFNLPFVVPSIPERWRRWHLSMSHWFRDYIFIPLGGSRQGTVRTQINIMIIMFLSGLWHGASNNFCRMGTCQWCNDGQSSFIEASVTGNVRIFWSE